MARSLFRDTLCLRGPAGLIPLAGAQVWFYEPNGAGVPGPAISYPLYADAHSTVTLPTPYVTGALGELEVWADLPHRAQIVAVKPGFAQVTETIDLEYPPELSATTDDIADAIRIHESEEDPHDQYLTQDEADLAYLKLTGGTLTGPLTVDAGLTVNGIHTAGSNIYPATNQTLQLGHGGALWAAIYTGMVGNPNGSVSLYAAPGYAVVPPTDGDVYLGMPTNRWANVYASVVTVRGQDTDTRYEQLARKGAASGYVPLGADTKIPNAYLPDLAITNTFVVTSEAEMLALNAQTGDVCVRLDTTENYILAAEPATVLANWTKLAASTTAGNTTIVKREEFAPAAASTAVALAAVPTQMLSVSRNGVEQSQPAGHYTVAGVTVTFTDAFVSGERVSVVYEVGSSAPAPINGYTKLESDARYEPIDTMYTKAESDAKYALLAHNHTGTYLPLTGGTVTGTIFVQGAADPGYRIAVGTTGLYFRNGTDNADDVNLTLQTGTGHLKYYTQRANAALYPEYNDANLGLSASRWGIVYSVAANLSGSLSVGTSAAVGAVGAIKLPNNQYLSWRNQGNTADVILGVNTSDQLASFATFVSDATNTRDFGTLSNRWRSAYLGTVLSIAGASATANQITHAITTDAQPRLIVDGNGKMRWGPGAAVAQDTNLERLGVSELGMSGADIRLTLNATTDAGYTALTMSDRGTRRWTFQAAGTENDTLTLYSEGTTANPGFKQRAAWGNNGSLTLTPDTATNALVAYGNVVVSRPVGPYLDVVASDNVATAYAAYRLGRGNSVYWSIGHNYSGSNADNLDIYCNALGANIASFARANGTLSLTPVGAGVAGLVVYGQSNFGSAPFAGYGCINVNVPVGMASLLTGYVRYGIDIAPSVQVGAAATGVTVASINAGLLGSSGAGSVMDNAYAAILSGPTLTNGGTISNAAALYVTNPTTGGAVAQNRVIIHGNTGASLTTAGAWTNAASWMEGKSDVKYVEKPDVALFADWFTMGWKPARYRYPALTEVEKSRAAEGNPVLRPVTNESEYDHFFTILDEVPQEVREVICVDDTGIISTKDMDGFLAALLQHALQRIVALEAKVNG